MVQIVRVGAFSFYFALEYLFMFLHLEILDKLTGGKVNAVVNPEDEIYKGGIPIKPKVTPGIAVAGVILMLAGVPYCLIGIKVKL